MSPTARVEPKQPPATPTTQRTLESKVSAMKRFPEASAKTPAGKLSWALLAAAPSPQAVCGSEQTTLGVPATVVMSPTARADPKHPPAVPTMQRITEFVVSAIKTLPPPSTNMAEGL